MSAMYGNAELVSLVTEINDGDLVLPVVYAMRKLFEKRKNVPREKFCTIFS